MPSTKALLEKSFLEAFPEEKDFLESLIAQYKFNSNHHLKIIMEMSLIYPRDSMKKAFSFSKEYNTYSSSFIRGILSDSEPWDIPTTIEGIVIPKVSVKRDLTVYPSL